MKRTDTQYVIKHKDAYFLFWTIHPRKRESIKTFKSWTKDFPEYKNISWRYLWKRLQKNGYECVLAHVTIDDMEANK